MANQPKKPDLKQDPLVDKARPEPSDPPAVELKGFLGESGQPGYRRLYLTSELVEYVEIAEADIVGRQSLASPEYPSRAPAFGSNQAPC